MPTPDEVRQQVADILSAVVDADPAAVRDEAVLKDLGVDSLALVELGDELGRRFSIYLDDPTIDGLLTVADAVRAVTEHGSRPVATSLGAEAPPRRSRSEAPSAATRLALWFVVAGLIIGGVLGLGGATIVKALKLDSVNLPPINAAETTPTPSASPSVSPSATPSEDEESEDPTFFIDPAQVSPGERFTISGRFPGLAADTELSVEVRDAQNPTWDSFAGVTIKSEGDGRFETKLYTSRTGEREFRVKVVSSGKTTPTAKVRIG